MDHESLQNENDTENCLTIQSLAENISRLQIKTRLATPSVETAQRPADNVSREQINSRTVMPSAEIVSKPVSKKY